MATRTNGNGNGRRTRRNGASSNGHPIRPRASAAKGTLIIIGGHEEREGKAIILRAVAERAKGGKLVVATLATSEPQKTYQEYHRAFTKLGVKHIGHLDVT